MGSTYSVDLSSYFCIKWTYSMTSYKVLKIENGELKDFYIGYMDKDRDMRGFGISLTSRKGIMR